MLGNHWANVAWSDMTDGTFNLKNKACLLKSDLLAVAKGHLCSTKAPGSKSTLWEMDVQALVSSPKWLQLHGLKRNSLTLSQIFEQIGFLQKPDYTCTLETPLSSRYENGLFRQRSKDDRVYNITARNETLLQKAESLTQAAELYRQRMDWLTSGSRQLFGVIQEHSITIVVDFGSLSKRQFDMCRDALCLILREQVSRISRFNLIRVAEDVVRWQDKSVYVSSHAINCAVEWIWKLEQLGVAGKNGPCEAILQAMGDKSVQAVYYFAVGDVPDRLQQSLHQMLSGSPFPINTVSFNSTDKETLLFMKELSHQTSGRFHAFAEITEYKNIRCITNGEEKTEDQISETKFKGGTPPGAGVREDVFLIWQEMEEARNTLIKIQAIAMQSSSYSTIEAKNENPLGQAKSDDYVSSREWLQKYSLKVQKLTIYDALADCAFRHSDGVVDIQTRPEDESLQTDADKRRKFVNAKYCDRFVHARWKDGSVVHVYVTSEKCRWYEERMKNAIEQLERRVKWLQQGSRELFGTVLEDQVCILIDTSQSMKDKLSLVKEKLFQLMQEQLRYKDKFNFIKFDARAASWKEKLADVNEENLENAWFWVKGLQVGSSTNTLQAIQLALADSSTCAVYLLSDGRPDQPTETIMAEIQMQTPVPIHTISFNCDDTEANQFLYELSNKTGGRFHCYSSDLRDPEAPRAFVSEDIHLLTKEIETGKNDLEKVQKLYAECLMLDWYHNGENGLNHKQTSLIQHRQTQRPHSSVEYPSTSPCVHRRKLHILASSMSLQKKKVLHAEQTRTSLLRALCNDAKLCEDVMAKQMLLENNELFLRNNLKSAVVIKELMKFEDEVTEKKTKSIPKDSLDMSSSRWLKTHGLVAQHLTIRDLLAPTAVRHTAKYVPVLDKHIVSKVFDEVLPIAHVSENTKLVTLINPLAVNLSMYKQKVGRVINACERRLNLLIWRALTQDERDKFESTVAVPYKEHKEALLQALDRLGWPISSDDVALLEEEIEAGVTYIQQATELQRQAKEKDMVPHSNMEGERVIEESPQVTRKEKERRNVLDTLKGQRVIARSELDGFYYLGTVQNCLNSKQALVDFSPGDTQITPIAFIVPVGGAVPCPPLKVGDFVFCKTGTEGGNCRYVPGIVIATPRRREAADKFYSVLKHDNRKEHTFRKDLIKTSKAKFIFSCHYIQEVQLVNHRIAHINIDKPNPKPPPGKDKSVEQTRRRKKKRNKKTEQKQQEKERTPSDSDSEDKSVDDKKPKEDENSSNKEEFNRGESKRSIDSPSSQPPDTPGRKFKLIQWKFKEMAEQFHQYQITQREQQEKIQACLEELASLKAHGGGSGVLRVQKEILQKQMELLKQFERLTPAGRRETDTQQGKAADNDNPDGAEPKNRGINAAHLTPGQMVLFRSPQNGWYRKGSIVYSFGDHTYCLRSHTGDVSRVRREEIISDKEGSGREVQEEDYVIGRHPLHQDSYCPGKVIQVSSTLQLVILYYDGVEALVPRDQTYPMTPDMFQRDLAYIEECEERWVGQPVVARDDKTGTYQLAEVQARVGHSRQYVIRWLDGMTVVQKASWIFGKYSQPHILKAGGHVLALAYPSSLTFLPAVILGANGAKLLVRFCNGESSRHVEPHLCFGLSEEQFNEAAQLYHKLVSEIKSGRRESDSEHDDSTSDTSPVSVTPNSSEEEDQSEALFPALF
ncbi:von Willebrand factor A domain-containing protein 3B [Lissotriton helveticus]